MKTEPAGTLLVSANPFDIIGAGAAGLRTTWCRRQPSALFDPWGSPPDHQITGLTALPDLLSR
jgi:2-haloacid dehalogenase